MKLGEKEPVSWTVRGVVPERRRRLVRLEAGLANSLPLLVTAGDAGSGPAAGGAAAQTAGPAAQTESGPSVSPAPGASRRGGAGAGVGVWDRPGSGPSAAAPGTHAYEHQYQALHPLLTALACLLLYLGRRKEEGPQRLWHLPGKEGTLRFLKAEFREHKAPRMRAERGNSGPKFLNKKALNPIKVCSLS